jgi:hypothetical protein
MTTSAPAYGPMVAEGIGVDVGLTAVADGDGDGAVPPEHAARTSIVMSTASRARGNGILHLLRDGPAK